MIVEFHNIFSRGINISSFMFCAPRHTNINLESLFLVVGTLIMILDFKLGFDSNIVTPQILGLWLAYEVTLSGFP